jgi:hypothetical protein
MGLRCAIWEAKRMELNLGMELNGNFKILPQI